MMSENSKRAETSDLQTNAASGDEDVEMVRENLPSLTL